LAQSKAALDFANIQFARVKDLVESRAIARQDYDTRKNAVDVGEAQVKQNEAAVESARLNLEYTSIRSPIDGRAGHRLVDVGNVVTANTSTLLTIERLDPIYADFTVTESDFSAVKRNSSNRMLKVEVRLPDQSDKPFAGQLTFLDNTVQSSSGTVLLRATVPNAGRLLWPGQFVNVRLILATLPKAVLVPATATQDSSKGPFVYVVKDDSTAELRPVKLGQRQGELIVVEQGLKPGERVVTTGQLGVMPGARCTLIRLRPRRRQRQEIHEPLRTIHSPARHDRSADRFRDRFRSAELFPPAGQRLPVVDYPVISVQANYPGASPDTVANNIATPLERQFMQINGLELVTSQSTQGHVALTLQFALDKSIDAAATDVQTAISQATGSLPVDFAISSHIQQNQPQRPTDFVYRPHQ